MHRILSAIRSRWTTLLPAIALGLGTTTLADTAHARPNVVRSGGQVDGLIGGSNCIPGRAQCRSDNPTLNGATRGSVGGGVSIGWRARRWLAFGAMYRGGHLRPRYEITGLDANYRQGAQHSIMAYVRPILPIWRFDLGLNLAPGYSRQIFYLSDDARDYTQGFVFMVGPSIDIFVTRRLFLGFEADFLFNAHGDVCEKRGSTRTCVETEDRHLAPVHQAIYGFHIGATFGRDRD